MKKLCSVLFFFGCIAALGWYCGWCYFCRDPRQYANELRLRGNSGAHPLEVFYVHILEGAPTDTSDAKRWAKGEDRWLTELRRAGFPKLVEKERDRRWQEYQQVLANYVNTHKEMPLEFEACEDTRLTAMMVLEGLSPYGLTREAVIAVVRKYISEPAWTGERYRPRGPSVLEQYRSSDNDRYRFARERLVWLTLAFKLAPQELKLVGLKDYEIPDVLKRVSRGQ